MISADDVRRVALSLPASTEKPSYGTPGFRDVEELTELLTEAWRVRAPQKLLTAFDARAQLNRLPDHCDGSAYSGRHRLTIVPMPSISVRT
ncbi:MAG: hypothetical protein WD271_10440 [Acidimicrobiia bacterium]